MRAPARRWGEPPTRSAAGSNRDGEPPRPRTTSLHRYATVLTRTVPGRSTSRAGSARWRAEALREEGAQTSQCGVGLAEVSGRQLESVLESAVHDAIVAEDLRRSLILRPDTLGPQPTTDGGSFHLEGVPIVNFLTAPMYLFDSADTIDRIHIPSLEPVSRAAVRIIEWTAGRTAKGVRADTLA